MTYEKLLSSYKIVVQNLDNLHIPNSIQEALVVPTWKKAVEEVIRAFKKNGTWILTTLPQGKRIVGCK